MRRLISTSTIGTLFWKTFFMGKYGVDHDQGRITDTGIMFAENKTVTDNRKIPSEEIGREMPRD